MEELPPLKSILIRLDGVMLALLYFTVRRSFLGFSLSGWLKFLPFLLALVAWWQRMAPAWILLALGLAVLIRLLYRRAKRNGYVSFVPIADDISRDAVRPIRDNERIHLWATGLFSVSHREAYMLQRPAEYWRVPIGDHAIMVQQESGGFLYQFVQSGALQQVQSGRLVFGPRSHRALAVTFLTTWGPEFGEGQASQFMPSGNSSTDKMKRTIYLSFDDNADKQSVWKNLLRDAKQPINKAL